jgi:predicted nucleic acid-binding protein
VFTGGPRFSGADLEEDVAKKLKERAKRHARSMEDEVRHILRTGGAATPGARSEAGHQDCPTLLRSWAQQRPSRAARHHRDRCGVRFVIVLDTNVLSALMRTKPDAVVVGWLDRQPADSIWVTGIAVFEARFALALLPKGRRRSSLERAFDRVLTEDPSGRGLNLDEMAAAIAGHLAAERHRAGCVVDLRDTLIDGIAQARRATIATRHTCHFGGSTYPSSTRGTHDPLIAQANGSLDESIGSLSPTALRHRGGDHSTA